MGEQEILVKNKWHVKHALTKREYKYIDDAHQSVQGRTKEGERKRENVSIKHLLKKVERKREKLSANPIRKCLLRFLRYAPIFTYGTPIHSFTHMQQDVEKEEHKDLILKKKSIWRNVQNLEMCEKERKSFTIIQKENMNEKDLSLGSNFVKYVHHFLKIN